MKTELLIVGAGAAGIAAALAAWFVIRGSGGVESTSVDRNINDLFFFPK